MEAMHSASYVQSAIEAAQRQKGPQMLRLDITNEQAKRFFEPIHEYYRYRNELDKES